MEKIMLKIGLMILLMLVIFTTIPNRTYAMSNVISSGDNFLNAGAGGNVIDEKALKDTSNYIYNILFTIAIVLAVAIGMIIGIQFMMGSAAEQAKIKETLIPYVIGVFVIFASFTIWKVVVNIGNKATAPAVSNQTTGKTTHTKVTEGGQVRYYCDNCGSELSTREQHNAKCYQCGYDISDI